MSGPWIAVVVALWVVVVMQAVLQIGLLRRVLPMVERGAHRGVGPPRLTGPPVGAALPDFEVTPPDGSVGTDAWKRDQPAIYLLVSGGCSPCESLGDEIRHAPADSLGVTLYLIVDHDDRRRWGQMPDGVTVLGQRGRAAANALEADATPHAIAVDANGVVVANTTPNTLQDLRELAGLATGATRQST